MLLQIVTACYAALRAALTIGLIRHQRSTADVPQAAPRASIIVAAHNEARALPTLLDALLAQTYANYEVIIVDDRSTDATPHMLQQARAQHDRLRIITIDQVPHQRTPKMYALGQGVRAAQGDLLLFTDADCRVPRTWVEGLVACFGPNVGAVLGYVDLQPTKNTVFERVQAFDYFAMMATMAGATKLGFPVGAAGANLAYRRAAYDQAGGFDQMPPGAVADDMLLVQRVLDRTALGIVFCDDPHTFIASSTVPTVKQLLAQRTRWMAGGQEILCNNPALLGMSSLIGTINGMLLFFPLFLLRHETRRALLQGVIVRTLADALHFGVAAQRFGRWDLLLYLPIWSVVQVPYTVGLPLYSLGRNVSWGGTKREDGGT